MVAIHQQQSSSTSSTSSRFNIEVNEVPTIRSTVSSTWKKSIHLPLRLDIYYEYDSCYDQQQQEDGAPPPPPQRELLERWCIDYIPSTSSSQSQSLYNSLSSSPSTSPYSSPYSSRILTGAITNSPRTDNNKSSSSSSYVTVTSSVQTNSYITKKFTLYDTNVTSISIEMCTNIEYVGCC